MKEFKVWASLTLALMLFVGSSTMAQDFGEWNTVTFELGSGQGVFRSRNGGDSWAAVDNGLTNPSVFALVIDPVTPSTLYAGSVGDGVFRSSDGGDTWAAINTGLTDLLISDLAIDPLVPSTLYAGTFTGGVFRRRDGGDSWVAINTGLTLPPQTTEPGSTRREISFKRVFALAIDPVRPSTLYAGTSGYPNPGGGVFRSSDGGDSWVAINTGLTHLDVRALAIDPVTPSTLYAGIFNPGGGVFRSRDGGDSWAAINTGLTHPSTFALAIDPLVPSTLYAGTSTGGVFRSIDGGNTWAGINTGLTHPFIFTLAIDPLVPSTLYAGTFNFARRVFRRRDGEDTWAANLPLSCFTQEGGT